MDHFDYRDGVLHGEDVALPDIADAIGTPFYCYSTATIERHLRVFREGLAGVNSGPDGPLIAYAVKANPKQSVVAMLSSMEIGRESCRRRGCQYVLISVGAGYLQKQTV